MAWCDAARCSRSWSDSFLLYQEEQFWFYYKALTLETPAKILNKISVWSISIENSTALQYKILLKNLWEKNLPYQKDIPSSPANELFNKINWYDTQHSSNNSKDFMINQLLQISVFYNRLPLYILYQSIMNLKSGQYHVVVWVRCLLRWGVWQRCKLICGLTSKALD